MKNRLLTIRRWKLINAFAEMGFRGFRAFCNVCKSLDVELDGFDLFEFWSGKPVSSGFCGRIENVIYQLKTE